MNKEYPRENVPEQDELDKKGGANNNSPERNGNQYKNGNTNPQEGGNDPKKNGNDNERQDANKGY